MNNVFKIGTKVWLYPGDNPWHFVTIPKDTSEEIKFLFGHLKRGWGSLRVKIKLGKTEWGTSIFPDKKAGAYILPLKAAIRKEENIKEGDNINFTLEIKTA